MPQIDLKDLTRTLIACSFKAARIAQVCREQRELFDLLVEEKKEGEANPRFLQDFKTLADVLVQETVRHDVAIVFPCLKPRVFGEESNQFTNLKSESVTVEVQPTKCETAHLLSKVLDGNIKAANLLSEAVHTNVDIGDTASLLDTSNANHTYLESDDVGIWIDPIDSTSEYIGGVWGEDNDPFASGLHCACVLLGVFRIHDGLPIAGVIHQPFYSKSSSSPSKISDEGFLSNDTKSFQSRVVWALYHPEGGSSLVFSPSSTDHFLSSSQMTDDSGTRHPIVVFSASESKEVIKAISDEFEPKFVAGAGYKLLSVALGLADAYVVSKGTTFQWDTCGPNAVLRALGGNIVSFDDPNEPIKYITDKKKASNSRGIIAFRDPAVLDRILKLLRNAKLI